MINRAAGRRGVSGPRYVIGRQIGAGGMGVVFEAQDVVRNRPVAIKFARESDHKRSAKQLAHEAAMMTLARGRGICTVHDVTLCGGEPCIVMEHLAGETLRSRLHARPVATTELLDWSVQLSEALAEIHAAGVVHQDLKPANIFITSNGRLKVLDFGVAAVCGDTRKANPDQGFASVMGTASYVAPERLLQEPPHFRSDLFSLGAVLYAAATGQPPFGDGPAGMTLFKLLEGKPKRLRVLSPDRPEALETIVHRLIARDVRDRYASASDARRDFIALARVGADRRVGGCGRELRPAVRRPAAVAVVNRAAAS